MLRLVGMGSFVSCSRGVVATPLVVIPSNPVFLNTGPAACILDCKPFVNIIPFGMCTSQTNPAVIAAWGAPVPCTPIPVPPMWITKRINTMLGVPILDEEGTTFCPLGGKISVKANQSDARQQ